MVSRMIQIQQPLRRDIRWLTSWAFQEMNATSNNVKLTGKKLASTCCPRPVVKTNFAGNICLFLTYDFTVPAKNDNGRKWALKKKKK